MAFSLSKAAKEYFKKIDDASKTGKFESMWDYYYLCLMAGFKDGRLGDDPNVEEFYKEFHSSYDSSKYQIMASLVSAEIRRQGIINADAEEIRKLMLNLLDKDATTKISKDGLKLMNRYADRGFKLITEKIPQPSELDEFIKNYYENFIDEE